MMKIEEGRISEGLVAQVWQNQWVVKERLFAHCGERLEVIYPGRANGDCGPDFCNAIVAPDGGELWKGDVEIHVYSSEWRAHGHHRDPRYNGVILHVVMWQDTAAPTLLQNGKAAPVLVLEHCLKGSMEELERLGAGMRRTEPCHSVARRLGKAAVGEILDRAGEERFRMKTAFFEGELAREEAAQILYEGVMGALGYAKNKEPFQRLASRLPLRVLEGFAQGKATHRCVLTLQALLFGAAGLLPDQRQRCAPLDDEDLRVVAEMEKIYRYFGNAESLGENEWHFFRVRPDNLPSRRLAGAAYLIASYIEKGLLEGITSIVAEAPVEKAWRELESALVVRVDGYWADHFDFGLRAKRNPALIGKGRAGEIAVNILLPFCHAWGEATSQCQLAKRALEVYRCYPRLEENAVTRQMGQLLGLEAGGGDSARQQQGLIHLFKTFCNQARCSDCALPAASSGY